MDVSSLGSSPTVRRRPFLRGIAGAVGFSLTGTATAAEPTYAPLGSVGIKGAKEAVVGENDVVYVAATDGFAIVDVSDPTAPSLITEQRTLLTDEEHGPLKSIADLKIEGDRLLVAGPAYPKSGERYLNAFVVYDVSTPGDPERIGWKETEMFHHNVFIRDGVVYLTGRGLQENPLVMVDVETVEELGRWSLLDVDPSWNAVPSALWILHDLWIQDGVAYLAYWDGGTWMVDVSDPANPSLIATVRGRSPSALAGLSGANETKLNRALFELPGNDHYLTVNDDTTLLGVGTEAKDVPPADPQAKPGGIELFNISQPTQPTSRSQIDSPTLPESNHWATAHNFEIVGNRLYASWFAGGVGLFDVSDPAAPSEIRTWRDPKTTSFWTAQAVHPGEFFIASSWVNPSTDTAAGAGKKSGARLYTFPEPPLKERQSTQQPTDGDSGETITETSGPGFGFTGAAVACAIGAWYSFRNRR